jgi:hypothetical protein
MRTEKSTAVPGSLKLGRACCAIKGIELIAIMVINRNALIFIVFRI